MAQAASKPTTNPPAFLNTVARIHLSYLFQDPLLRAAFKAAEDDGLAPALVDIDNPLTLDGEKPIADVSSMAEIVVQTMREHARLEAGDVTISATSWETLWFAVFHLKEMIEDLHERYHRD